MAEGKRALTIPLLVIHWPRPPRPCHHKEVRKCKACLPLAHKEWKMETSVHCDGRWGHAGPKSGSETGSKERRGLDLIMPRGMKHSQLCFAEERDGPMKCIVPGAAGKLMGARLAERMPGKRWEKELQRTPMRPPCSTALTWPSPAGRSPTLQAAGQ